jgi:hypothetical protein
MDKKYGLKRGEEVMMIKAMIYTLMLLIMSTLLDTQKASVILMEML